MVVDYEYLSTCCGAPEAYESRDHWSPCVNCGEMAEHTNEEE
jgi:hypothetical protein